MKLSILMPVYNENSTLDEIIKKVKEVEINKEIIIVDDCSTDGSREHLKELENKENEKCDPAKNNEITNEIKIFFNKKNLGKGASIREAIKHITGDIVIIQDADLEYDPADYKKLLNPIIENKADVVYGSRFIGGQTHRVLFFWHYVGNKMLTLLSNMLTDLNLTDMECCYKVFKTEVIKNIELKSNRFGIEPELTARIAKKKYRIYETAISYYGRDYSEGKKITWKDGFVALYVIIKCRFFD